MLVLSRKINESIIVSGPCRITIVRIQGDKCRVGIEADQDVEIMREELADGWRGRGHGPADLGHGEGR